MNYSCSIQIDLPRDRVIELMNDPDNLQKWQTSLVSFRQISGEMGETGGVMEMVHKMGSRTIVMTETIENQAFPDVFVATYEAPKVWNRVENRFSDQGGSTLWEMDCEFRRGGMVRVMAFFMPGMFRKQTEKTMQDFKTFAEAA